MNLERFLSALREPEDSTNFVQAVYEHVERLEGCNLDEVIETTPKKRLIEICEGLKNQVELGIQKFVAPSPPAEADSGLDLELYIAEQRDDGYEVLSATAIVARMVLAFCKDATPEPLLEAIALLHDNAFPASMDYRPLKDEIVKVCMDCWQAGVPGKEQFMPHTVVHLVLEALEAGTAISVKRCHAMRTALGLFDFEHPSTEDLKCVLLRAAFAPAFLRASEGRRFLSHLFTLQPAFVKELTAIVKNQIPAGRKSVLDAYGDIIYRAWSSANGACLLEIQDGCIQALMEAAIYASTQPMAAAVRRVLNGLHCQKHQPGVDRMLLELYEPILFRNLNAANPEVRRNALRVFVDAFPLRDPDEPNDLTDKRMTEQFQKLSALLKDDAPAVRVAAIQGVCRILDTFWEVIPGAVTAGYVKVIAGELAFDAASPAVRAEAAEGLAILVDNPLAQPLLKVVLPKMEPLLFDASLRVRTAMMDLILSLRGIQALPWHECFSLQKMLDIMANDSAPMAERIQKLLLPSYFPDLNSGPALVAALLRAAPDAGRAFCLYLAGVRRPVISSPEGAEALSSGPAVQPEDLVSLAGDLIAHLLEVPLSSNDGGDKKGGKKGRAKRKKKGAAAEEEEQMQEVVESHESWTAILGGVEAICSGLALLVASSQCEAAAVNRLFANGELTSILARCATPAARAATYSIGAALSSCPGCASVRTSAMEHVMAGDIEDAVELNAALCCGAAQPKTWNKILMSVCTALGLDNPLGDAAPSKPKKGDFQKMSLSLSLRYLNCLMGMEYSRKVLLSSGTLLRLLPCLVALLQSKVQALDLAEGSMEVEEGEGGVHEVFVAALTAVLHLALATREELVALNGDGDEIASRSEMKVEAAKAYCQVMSAVRDVLERLPEVPLTQLLEAMGAHATEARPKRSKSKKSASTSTTASPDHSPVAAAIAAVRASLALSVEATQLGALDTARNQREAAATATAMLDLAVRLDTAAREADLDAGNCLIVTVSHCAALARGLAYHAATTSIANNLGPAFEGEVDDDGARDDGVEGLVQALLATVLKHEGAAPASKPHLCGLLAALAAGSHSKCLAGPLVQAVAPPTTDEVEIDGTPATDENTESNNRTATNPVVAQKAAVNQVITAAKFAKIHEWLAGEASSLAVAAWTSGDVTTAIQGVALAALLGFNGLGRGKKKRGQFEEAIKHLQELKSRMNEGEDEGSDRAVGVLRERLNDFFADEIAIAV